MQQPLAAFKLGCLQALLSILLVIQQLLAAFKLCLLYSSLWLPSNFFFLSYSSLWLPQALLAKQQPRALLAIQQPLAAFKL